jgi:hypothetical protein
MAGTRSLPEHCGFYPDATGVPGAMLDCQQQWRCGSISCRIVRHLPRNNRR